MVIGRQRPTLELDGVLPLGTPLETSTIAGPHRPPRRTAEPRSGGDRSRPLWHLHGGDDADEAGDEPVAGSNQASRLHRERPLTRASISARVRARERALEVQEPEFGRQ